MISSFLYPMKMFTCKTNTIFITTMCHKGCDFFSFINVITHRNTHRCRLKHTYFHGLFVGSSYEETYVIVEPDVRYHSIETMMNLLHAPMDDIVVFGDGNNDVAIDKKRPVSLNTFRVSFVFSEIKG